MRHFCRFTGLLLSNDTTFDAVCEALEGLDGYPVFDEKSAVCLRVRKYRFCLGFLGC